MSFWQLFLTNIRIIYRNRTGFFWTIIMPMALYVALSVLPLDNFPGISESYALFLLPGMIALTIMQGGIYTLAYWMVDIRARGVIKRFMVTPLNRLELIVSVLFARVCVIILQVILLTAIGLIFFDASFQNNVISTLIFVIVGGMIFLLMGLFISRFADSYESAAPITTAIGLPFIFLGNVFYPVDSLPQVLRSVSQFLPITYLADGLRKLYLNPFDFSLIYGDLVILIIWLLVMLVVNLIGYKFEENA